MFGYISPITTYIEEFFDRPIFLTQHTKLGFCSNKPFFYCVLPKYISDKFTLIRELCRFLRLGLISISFEKELGLYNVKHEWMYKPIMDLIPNNWKHILLWTETSQKSLLTTFCYNNKGTRKTGPILAVYCMQPPALFIFFVQFF